MSTKENPIIIINEKENEKEKTKLKQQELDIYDSYFNYHFGNQKEMDQIIPSHSKISWPDLSLSILNTIQEINIRENQITSQQNQLLKQQQEVAKLKRKYIQTIDQIVKQNKEKNRLIEIENQKKQEKKKRQPYHPLYKDAYGQKTIQNTNCINCKRSVQVKFKVPQEKTDQWKCTIKPQCNCYFKIKK